MENLLLIISVMGAVISFLTFVVVAIIGFVIKNIYGSVNKAHERLDDHILDNGKEHTAIHAEIHEVLT
jgi:archaellum component FlaF (FlaF/FlaG flagellin family)